MSPQLDGGNQQGGPTMDCAAASRALHDLMHFRTIYTFLRAAIERHDAPGIRQAQEELAALKGAVSAAIERTGLPGTITLCEDPALGGEHRTVELVTVAADYEMAERYNAQPALVSFCLDSVIYKYMGLVCELAPTADCRKETGGSMGRLIDQLCEATAEWARRTGQAEETIPHYAMSYLGAVYFHPPVGKVDPATVSPERRPYLSASELHGYHTLAQLKWCLEFLVSQMRMREDFLVPAIVRAIEGEFEALAEDYGKAMRNRRKLKERLEQISADPDLRAAYVQQMTQVNPGAFGPEGYTEAHLQCNLDWATRNSVAVLTELKERHGVLKAWQEVTAPMLEHDNLSATFDEQFGSAQIRQNWKDFLG